MSDLPAPAAARLRRPRWLDTRLLLGILLVLVSVVLGAKVVAEADDTVGVWALDHDLGPGSPITPDDLVVKHVRLDGNGPQYVRATDKALNLTGFVVRRAVAQGELLPASAIVATAERDLRRVSIQVRAGLAEGLERGQVVDVYVVPKAVGSEAPRPPRLVLADLTVADVPQNASAIGSTASERTVVLLVQRPVIPQLLAATVDGEVSLVQQPRPGDPQAQ